MGLLLWQCGELYKVCACACGVCCPFQDLAVLVDNKLLHEKDEYNKSCLKVLSNYLSKFKKGGRNSALWNGPTTFNPQENFVVFNFQKLLANKNNVTANAQMLLVLKWLDNEVIKNRDYNNLYKTNRKIIYRSQV